MKIRLIILFVSFLFLISFASATSPLPCDFWGYGDLNVGNVVETYSKEVLCGAFTVLNQGEYGALHCRIDDPETPEQDGALNGDNISFKVNGQIVEDVEMICNSAASDQVDLGEKRNENSEPQEDNETNGNNQTQEEIPSEQINGGGGGSSSSGKSRDNSKANNKNVSKTTGQAISESYSVEEVSENEDQQEEMNLEEEQKSQNSITGAIIGFTKKTGKIVFYFFGILLIGFILLKGFKFYQKRKADPFRNYNPKPYRVIKYSDFIKQQRGRENG